MPMVAGQMEEESMEAVIKAAEDAGLSWSDLSDEEKQTLYKDYTGEEASISKIEELVASTRGGTQAGRIFVADSMGEALASVGTAYGAKKKRDALSKQKAQAYELAGGLAAGQAQADRQQQMDMMKVLREPPIPPGQDANAAGGATPPPQGGAPPPAGPPPTAGPPGSMRMNPNTAGGGGGPSPPGQFPQGGPPIAPGNPGAPPPNAPQMDLSRRPPAPPQGGPQGGLPPDPSSPQAGQGGNPMMQKLMEKMKLDEWLKKLRGGQ